MRTRVREATFIALIICPDCGGRVLVFQDDDQCVFAQAHLEEEWLQSDLIPLLQDPNWGQTKQ